MAPGPAAGGEPDKQRVPLPRRLGRFGAQALRAPMVATALAVHFGPGTVNLRAAHRVVVVPRLGLAFNRIKKNANTTVVSLLQEIETGRVAHRDIAKWEARTLWDLGPRALAGLGALRFAVVVRNPYSRLLSAFLDKFREPGYRRRHGEFPLAPEGFAEFVRWLEAGGLQRDAHWGPQRRLMLLPAARYDHLVRFETLGPEMSALLAGLGTEVPEGRLAGLYPSDRRKGTGAQSRLAGFYDADTARRVARLYAGDFAELGYSPALPD